MKKRFSKTTLFIILALLFALTLKTTANLQLQGKAATFISFFWSPLAHFRQETLSFSTKEKELAEKIEWLEIENHHLQSKIDRLQELLTQSDIFVQGKEGNKNAKMATVIFRSQSLWNQFLWIDVGNRDNLPFKEPLIAINSPVVKGNSLVGVIDYVGEHQARVCLITNNQLNPSVRAVRGSVRQAHLFEHFHQFLADLQNSPESFAPYMTQANEPTLLLNYLKKIEGKWTNEGETLYLAKGELQGAARPLYRELGGVLRGVGFNSDFADKESPARDLRSGKPLAMSPRELSQAPLLPLLQAKDLLITTGFDGVFPAGLKVAEVSHVFPLKSGDCAYSLEAIPTAGTFDELDHVFVLSPVGFDKLERPPPL